MPEMINKHDLVILMEKCADYDSQPRACKRMVKLVRSFPPEKVVSEDVFTALLARYQADASPSDQDIAQWKQKAGLM